MITLPPPEAQPTPSKDDAHLRRAADGDIGSCQTCLNWSAAGMCQVLNLTTLPVMICDMFVPLEGGGEETSMASGEPPMDLAQLMGGMG